MSWSHCDWRHDVVLPAALAVLRACWLWPWLQLVQRWLPPSRQGALLPLPLLAGITLLGGVTARKALAGSTSLRHGRLLVASAGIGVILLLFWWQFFRSQYPLWSAQWPIALAMRLTHSGADLLAALLTLAAATYLWLRGVLDGQRALNGDDIRGAVTGGVVALALCLGVASLDARGVPAGMGKLVLLFFGTGMVALAVSGLQLASGSRLRAEEGRISRSRYWLASVILLTLTLLGLSVALSAIVAPATIAEALKWASALLDILGRGLYLLFYAFSYLLFLILVPLIGLLRALLSAGAPVEPQPMPDLQQQFRNLPTNAAALPPALANGLRWGGLAILVLGIGALFALALRRFWHDQGEEIEETREIVFSRTLLQTQLSSLWHKWLQGLHRAVAHAAPYLPLDSEMPSRRAIRAIYQDLLAAMTRQGQARARYQTPTEYQHTLAQSLPGSEEMVSAITTGYLEARYASEPPSEGTVQRVRLAWDRLKAWLDQQSPESSERE